jgi:hypothetical protein
MMLFDLPLFWALGYVILFLRTFSQFLKHQAEMQAMLADMPVHIPRPPPWIAIS